MWEKGKKGKGDDSTGAVRERVRGDVGIGERKGGEERVMSAL